MSIFLDKDRGIVRSASTGHTFLRTINTFIRKHKLRIGAKSAKVLSTSFGKFGIGMAWHRNFKICLIFLIVFLNMFLLKVEVI